jgi:pyruvate,water dikinase
MPIAAMGVIVQVQVDARVAGVLFTRSPEAGRDDDMLCEYCEGLADRLVAGEISPSRVAIRRDTLKPCPPNQPGADPALALDDDLLEALGVAALACERLFGGPQDIEWAIDQAGKLWIVQSRPITAPADAGGSVVWSNANVSENFPAPISPLLYSIAARGYEHYFRNLGIAFGISRMRLAAMDQHFRTIIGVHSGRMYYNLSAIHAVLGAVPFGERLTAYFDEFTGTRNPCGTKRTAPNRQTWQREVLELANVVVNVARQYLRVDRRVAAFEARIDDFALRADPARLAGLTAFDLRNLVREFMDIRTNRWTGAALADAAAMVCYGALKAAVARVYPADAGAGALHNALLKGLSGLISAAPVEALWALARDVRTDRGLRELFESFSGDEINRRLRDDARLQAFRVAFDDYLTHWGFRCSGELMLTVASFQERPHELLEIIRTYALDSETNPEVRLAEQRADREQTTIRVLRDARAKRVVRWLPWPTQATIVKPLLSATQAAIGLRERARLKQALLYSRLRRIVLAIGVRLVDRDVIVERDDVFYLTHEELDQLLSGAAMFPRETAKLIALRRAAHARFESCAPADAFSAAEGAYPEASIARSAGTGQTSFKGTTVCSGVARGTARVLAEVCETRFLKAGDILVTRQTDPGWAPAFLTIGGLVLERGGMLSHGAILAREYGIPTVVGVPGVTQNITTGAGLEVDGDQGHVRVLA